MRKIDNLKKVLEKHLHWIRKDCDGWEDMRADLTGADLTGANLYRADLTCANLTGAKAIGWCIRKGDAEWLI